MPYERDREDQAAGEGIHREWLDRESTEAEMLEAVELGAAEELQADLDSIVAAAKATFENTSFLFDELRKAGVL